MESPRLTASGFIRQGTKFGPFHGIIKKTTEEDSQFVDEEGVNYRLTLDKSKTPANQAWLAQLQSATSRQYNLRIFKEDKCVWCLAVDDIDEGQPLTAIYQSEADKMQDNTDATKVPLKRVCVCQFCHIQFRNPSNLQVHIQHYCQKIDVSSSDTTDSIQKANNENTSTMEFVCQLCRSTFSNHSNCETHMIKLHGETEANLCKFCTYIAGNSQTLTAHMFQQHVLVYRNRVCQSTKTVDTTQEALNVVDTEVTCRIKEEIKSEPGVPNSIQDDQSIAGATVLRSDGSSSKPDKAYRCKNCSFTTHLQVNFDQHECHRAGETKEADSQISVIENNNNTLTQLSEADVSSTTITSSPVDASQQGVLSCTACNITFKSIRNFSAHKTYYCANRQFANDLYIAKLQKRQRVSIGDEEPLKKRSRFYTSPTDRSPENEITTKPVAISIEQSGHSVIMPMLCLSRPTSNASSDSDHRELIDVKQERRSPVASQEKPLDLSVRKSPPTSDQSPSNTVPLVRPTSLDVQMPRAIVLGYKCIECDILFHKQESLKVHKQYYCATRHQPSPQRASPIRNSPRNGALSRNSSRSPVSPGLIMERDDSCTSPGKMSPDAIQGDLQRALAKTSPGHGEVQAHCPSPLSRIQQPASSVFRVTRGEHGRSLSSPRQADRGSPGNATSPTSSQLGVIPQSAAGTVTSPDGGTPNTLVMRYQTTPYHDTMVTSKDLQSSVSTGQRKIYCVCGAVFRNYDIYVAHKENYCSYRNMMATTTALHTPTDKQDSQNNDDEKTNRNDTIVCNICQNKFANFSDLKNHKCVSCVCPACPFVGSNLSQLQDHFKEHPGLLLDSSAANCSPADDKVNIANSQPIRITREGAKRRKSTTPHALHAKQAKLDEDVITSEMKSVETDEEQAIIANAPRQTRQSVITNTKPDLVNIKSDTVESCLELSSAADTPVSPVGSNVTAEWEADSESSDHDSKTIKTESNPRKADIEAGDEHDKLTTLQTIGTPEEDVTKSKKNSKSNAKLCRTCDLHFNNLSTFIAHRKYYCGASNQITKT